MCHSSGSVRSVWQCFMLWFTLFPLSPVARVVGSIRVPAFLLGIQACWPTPSSFSLALTSSSRERRAVLAFREPTFFFLRFYLFERERDRDSEREHKWGVGRGKSRFPTEQGAQSRLHLRSLGSWTESGRQTLDQLSHPGVLRVDFLNTCSKLVTVTWDRAWAGGHLKSTLSVRLHSSSLLQPVLPAVLSNTKGHALSLWLPPFWSVSISVWGCFYFSWGALRILMQITWWLDLRGPRILSGE